MQAFVKSFALITCLSTSAWAVSPQTTTVVAATATTTAATNPAPPSTVVEPTQPLTAEQIAKEKLLQVRFWGFPAR